MPRNAEKTADAIRSAGIRLFNRQGYAATTLRDIAADVGIKVGSVYNHIDAKEDLLFSIMSDVMQDLVTVTGRALESQPSPQTRLQAMIETSVTFHGERAQEVFIGNSELRSLSGPRRAVIVELRDSYEKLFRTTLEAGVGAGVFATTDVRIVTYGMVSLCAQVSGWYQRDGRRSLAEIAATYADFVLRSLTNPSLSVGPDNLLALTIASR